MDWKEEYKKRVYSPEEAVKKIKSNKSCCYMPRSRRTTNFGRCNGEKLQGI